MDQLNTALNTRIVIEQAKGIVSERAKLDMEHAFASFAATPDSTTLRLADVAAAVVSGALSSSALRPAVAGRPAQRKKP